MDSIADKVATALETYQQRARDSNLLLAHSFFSDEWGRKSTDCKDACKVEKDQ